jgi:ribonuclease III
MGMGFFRQFASLIRTKPKIQGDSDSWEPIAGRIAYRFRDKRLLRQALTHRSCFQTSEEHKLSNERLELLGDAVLGLVVTETLYRRYPDKSEGELTRLKSLMVSREVLAREAIQLELGQFMRLGSGEEQSGGRNRRSIMADAFEALLGAVYLDGGFGAAREFVHAFLLRDMTRFLADGFGGNYKSLLLEYVQGKGRGAPKYRVVEESGPDHRKEFTVEVLVKGEVLGRGQGPNKKTAEQHAAKQAADAYGLLLEL